MALGFIPGARDRSGEYGSTHRFVGTTEARGEELLLIIVGCRDALIALIILYKRHIFLSFQTKN